MEKLKLLICDDELNIRQGLKCILDWDSLGYIICGEASNGKDAVNQAKDLNPDLIILDIKMPGLTGIEVISQIKEYYQSANKIMPSIIILSGYAEFDYAQKTLNEGAKAYLLKPVDEEALEKKVIEITNQIKQSQKLFKTTNDVKDIVDSELVLKVLNSKKVENEIINDSEFFKNYQESFYQCIIVYADFCVDFGKDNFMKSMDNYFSFFTNKIIFNQNKIIICLKTQNQVAVDKCVERSARLNPQNTYITMGKCYCGLQGLQDSYNEALDLEKYLYFINNLPCLKTENKIEQKEILEKDLDDFINSFVFCIETYDKIQLMKKTNELKELLLMSNKVQSCKQNLIYILIEVKNRLLSKHPERELESLDNKSLVDRILSSKTFTEAFNYVCSNLDKYVESFNFNTADSIVVKVISYIKTNYNKDLKLELLGDLFNCNSAYLGKKFTKYTGVQFNTYLDNIRIEAAKEKLLNSDLKIYQISKLVGYTNTDYFFMKFKKSTGLTPKEFQKQAGKDVQPE